MNEYVLAGIIFASCYLFNAVIITVFYHRGFAHGALKVAPRAQRAIATIGSWVTGIDAKAWACMHRNHHRHADTHQDPHSPKNVGLLGVATAQLAAYITFLSLLVQGHTRTCAMVEDLPFPVSWVNRKRLWVLPYLLHLAIGVVLALVFDFWLFGVAYFVGIASHPIQGWLVNSFGHAMGYRTYPLSDDSRNNILVALIVVGEGFQNNHHHAPTSPKLSVRWWEIDLGYAFCVFFEKIGLISMAKDVRDG